MIIGIGFDIIEVARIRKAIENPRFLARVYTSDEIAYCNARGRQSSLSFAARFAAKEAVAKALGTGFRNAALHDVEIINDEMGKPMVRLTENLKKLANAKGCVRLHVSLSHTAAYAVAQVILEGDGK